MLEVTFPDHPCFVVRDSMLAADRPSGLRTFRLTNSLAWILRTPRSSRSLQNLISQVAMAVKSSRLLLMAGMFCREANSTIARYQAFTSSEPRNVEKKFNRHLIPSLITVLCAFPPPKTLLATTSTLQQNYDFLIKALHTPFNRTAYARIISLPWQILYPTSWPSQRSRTT